MTQLALAQRKPFAEGGNRLCYTAPDDPGLCIKLLREDRSPAIKRALKGFPRSLKPLHYFDDNLQELRTYRRLHRRLGDALHSVCPVIHGLVDTDLGEGLACELIRDDDGRVSVSLKQYLWEHGLTDALQRAVSEFGERWLRLTVPSRDLLLHNIVVQCDAAQQIRRLVVIDGIGSPTLVPLDTLIPALGRRRVRRRLRNLDQRIQHLIHHQAGGGGKGYHGFIESGNR